jgi:hypothetical protein
MTDYSHLPASYFFRNQIKLSLDHAYQVDTQAYQIWYPQLIFTLLAPPTCCRL